MYRQIYKYGGGVHILRQRVYFTLRQKMSFWKFIRFASYTVTILLLFLQLIMAGSLSKPLKDAAFNPNGTTTSKGIKYYFIEHFDPQHSQVHKILNTRLGRCTRMMLQEMKGNDKVLTTDGKNGSDYDHVAADAVKCIQEWLVTNVVDNVNDAYKSNARTLMGKIVLYYGYKNKYYDLETQDDFLSANKYYFGKDSNKHRPVEVTAAGFFAVYVDINNWWPAVEPPFFDGIDWSRLYTFQQTPSATSLSISTNATSTNATDPKLLTALKDLVDIQKEERAPQLMPYNATSGTGVPDEVIKRNKNKLDPLYFMTKAEMTLFNNELTKDRSGTQQDRVFVCSPLTGTVFLIFYDGTLYRYLLSQKPKQKREFIDDFPKLKGMTARDWYEFSQVLQHNAYQHCTFVLPYNCQKRDRNYEGFNMGDAEDPNNTIEIDVPNCYQNVKDSWNNQIIAGVEKPGILPDEAKNIQKSSNNNGFAFLYSMHQRLNPLLISLPTTIVA